MTEQSIASARASVMVYDDMNKKWVPSGSSSGLSKVHIYQHLTNNTFRVVGRKLQDHEVVINASILKGLKYNQATPTFHQWRDNKQVYGLNFSSRDDAEAFAVAMLRTLEAVNQNRTLESSDESCKRGYIAEDNHEASSKKPCQRSYRQDEKKGITLKITCKDNDRDVTEADSIFIGSAIEENMLLSAGKIQPQVERTTLWWDGLYILCKDQKTLDWLKTVVNDLSPPEDDHPGFIALGPGDRPPIQCFRVWFPGSRDSAKSVQLLGICNSGLDSKKIAVREVIPGEGGNTLVLEVAMEMVDILKKNDFSLYCGLGKVHFKDPAVIKTEQKPLTENSSKETTSHRNSSLIKHKVQLE